MRRHRNPLRDQPGNNSSSPNQQVAQNPLQQAKTQSSSSESFSSAKGSIQSPVQHATCSHEDKEFNAVFGLNMSSSPDIVTTSLLSKLELSNSHNNYDAVASADATAGSSVSQNNATAVSESELSDDDELCASVASNSLYNKYMAMVKNYENQPFHGECDSDNESMLSFVNEIVSYRRPKNSSALATAADDEDDDDDSLPIMDPTTHRLVTRYGRVKHGFTKPDPPPLPLKDELEVVINNIKQGKALNQQKEPPPIVFKIQQAVVEPIPPTVEQDSLEVLTNLLDKHEPVTALKPAIKVDNNNTTSSSSSEESTPKHNHNTDSESTTSVDTLHNEDSNPLVSPTNIPVRVYAYAKQFVRPFPSEEEVGFIKDWYEYTQMAPNKLQMAAWPSVVTGKSVVIIDEDESNGLQSFVNYMPAVCHMVKFEMQTADTPPKMGPMCIVATYTKQTAMDIHELCLKHMPQRIQNCCSRMMYSPGENDANTMTVLMNGCGILIACISDLVQLIDSCKAFTMFDMERLLCVVCDRVDLIMQHKDDDLLKLTNYYTSAGVLKAVCDGRMQAIYSSAIWQRPAFESLIKTPNFVYCFSDPMDVAYAANVQFELRFVGSKRKKREIFRYLKANLKPHSAERFMIVCHGPDRPQSILEYLQKKGYTAHLHQQGLQNWQANAILIASDLYIDAHNLPGNINHLIHYGLSGTVGEFKQRFLAFEDHCDRLITKARQSKKQHRTFLLVTVENDHAPLWTLINFYKRYGLPLSDFQQHKISELMDSIEQKRIAQGVPLCSKLLTNANCLNIRCAFRHKPATIDMPSGPPYRLQEKEVIKIRVLKVFDPSHFSVHVLRNECEKHVLPSTETIYPTMVNISKFYMKAVNRVAHGVPKLGDVCIINYENQYGRVRIALVPANVPNTQAKCITATLMDLSSAMITVAAEQLYRCDAAFSKLPPLAADLRIIGFDPANFKVPLNSFTCRIRKEIFSKGTCEFSACVDFAIEGTIFANNIFLNKKLKNVRTPVTIFNLRNILTSNSRNGMDLSLAAQIRKTFAALTTAKVQKTAEPEQVKLPSETTMQDALTAAEPAASVSQTLAQAQATAPAPIILPVVLNNNNNEAISSKLPTPVKIQPKGVWLTMPTRRLLQVQLGSGQVKLLQNGFLVRTAPLKGNANFAKLEALIEKHVDEIASLQLELGIGKTIDLREVQLHNNFVVHRYGRKYARAILERIHDNNSYEFLLTDYAERITLDATRMRQPFIYNSKQSLIDCMPYQIAYCYLSGIQPTAQSDNFVLFEEETTFVIPTLELDSAECGMNVYSVLLYTVPGANPTNLINDYKLINELVVSKGYATYNSEDRIEPALCAQLLESELENKKLMEFEHTFSKCLQDSEDESNILNFLEVAQGNVKQKTTNGVSNGTKAKQSSTSLLTNGNGAAKPQLSAGKRLPALTSSRYAHPNVKWHQTRTYVCFTIPIDEHADYELVYVNQQLLYCTRNIVPISLFNVKLDACIPNQVVQHERRGLFVVVKLVKELGDWEVRLPKLPWLKCNTEAEHCDAFEMCPEAEHCLTNAYKLKKAEIEMFNSDSDEEDAISLHSNDDDLEES